MNDYVNIYMLLLFVFIKSCIILFLYSNIIFRSTLDSDVSQNGVFTRGIDNFFVDSNMKSFHLYLTTHLTKMLNVQLIPLQLDFTNIKDMFHKKIKDNQNAEDAAKMKQKDLETNIKDTTGEMKETINSIIDYQQKNITAMKTTYTMFFDRFKKYVQNMLNILPILHRQYDLAFITDKLKTSIVPIQQAYNAIRDKLIQNSEFIKDYFEINTADIPSLISKLSAPSTINANFKTTDNLVQQISL